jgi:multisubunit Na+/H+ antiporter MnhB subunit
VTGALTDAVARLLLPCGMVIGAAVLVKGYVDVGDGFAAGVIVALTVLLLYMTLGVEGAERVVPGRYAARVAVAGLLITLGVAFVPAILGDPILTHSPAPGAEVVEIGTVEIITAVAFDVGVGLLVAGSVVGLVRLVALTSDEEHAS